MLILCNFDFTKTFNLIIKSSIMRSLILCAAAIILTSTVLAQTPDKSEYFADGTVKAEYFIADNGSIDAKFYYKTGELRETGQFVNYKRHGEWISYTRSGSVSSKGFFDHGSKTGVWKFWDPDGTLAQEVDYSGDKPELLVHTEK